MLLMQFVLAYWHLFAALVIILFLLFSDPIRCRIHGIELCSNNAFVNALKRKHNVLLHLGDDEDFAKGHIKGSKLMLWTNLKQHAAHLKLEKDRPISIASRNLAFAHKLAYRLASLGYTQIALLKGGLPAWEKESFPLVRHTAPKT